jgi:hypothetical protein
MSTSESTDTDNGTDQDHQEDNDKVITHEERYNFNNIICYLHSNTDDTLRTSLNNLHFPEWPLELFNLSPTDFLENDVDISRLLQLLIDIKARPGRILQTIDIEEFFKVLDIADYDENVIHNVKLRINRLLE